MADLTDFYPQAAGNMAPPTPMPLAVSGAVSQQLSGNLSVSGLPWWLLGALVAGALYLHWLG